MCVPTSDSAATGGMPALLLGGVHIGMKQMSPGTKAAEQDDERPRD